MAAPEESPNQSPPSAPEPAAPAAGELEGSDGQAKYRRRNLILCSDGTGMGASKADGTNVWRIYQALDREHHAIEQIAIHDDGVGSSNNQLLAALGGAMGLGLARNVRELYTWLCKHYLKGDNIYLFCFSRGAFTVRCLAGMITRFGVLDATDVSLEELHKQVNRVWFAFKDSQYDAADPDDAELNRRWTHKILAKLLGKLRKPKAGPKFHTDVKIEFIGVWDTVDAYGLPVDELKEAFAWASRKIFRHPPFHYLALTRFNDRKLSPKINNAYHAVAIDDERHTFHPVLWDTSGTESRWDTREESTSPGQPAKNGEEKAPKPNLQQVWFTGMHADVGGGYARGSLSLVPLDWMMTKAEGHGLVFSKHARDELHSKMSPHGPMHDSRSGAGAYYRYKPRNITKLCADHGIKVPVVHESVLQRIKALRGEGAPAVLPPNLEVVGNQGPPSKVVDPDSSPDYGCLVRLRMLHWRRWFLYFFFLLWTGALVALLVAGPGITADQPAPPWKFLGIGYLMSLVQRFTPGALSDAIGTLRALPFWTLSMAAALAFLGWRRHSLVGQIRELRRAAWNKKTRAKLFARKGWSPTDGAFVALDAADGWRGVKDHEKTVGARLVVAAVIALIGFWIYSWVTSGVMVPDDFVVSPITIEHRPMGTVDNFSFATNDPALVIGPVLEGGERYSISVQASGWADGRTEATPLGLDAGPGEPMRFLFGYRDWRRPSFALLGTMGSENGETFVIGYEYDTGVLPNDTRLFVFVNDRICYWCPWAGAWYYYDDNKGTATITIERLPRE